MTEIGDRDGCFVATVDNISKYQHIDILCVEISIYVNRLIEFV